jgi:hypothetical protein
MCQTKVGCICDVIDKQDRDRSSNSDAQTDSRKRGSGAQQKNLNGLIRSRSYHKTNGANKTCHKLARDYVKNARSFRFFGLHEFAIYTEGHRKGIPDRRPLVRLDQSGRK